MVGYWMRNGFREKLVTGLKHRGYHGKKACRQTYPGGGQKERCRDRKTSAKGHGNGCIGSKEMMGLGARGRVSGGWLHH